MCKITEQIFRGHKTHMSILMSFFCHFLLKLEFLWLFFLLFSFLNFDFTIYFAFWYSIQYLGNKLRSSIIDQTGKTAFIVEFFTVANTLKMVKALVLFI